MHALDALQNAVGLAARSMRVPVATRIRSITRPNIRFGMFSAFLLTFILSWDEIGVTLFITSIEATTFPRRMWMGLRDNGDLAVAALSVLLIVMVTTVVLLQLMWQSRYPQTS